MVILKLKTTFLLFVCFSLNKANAAPTVKAKASLACAKEGEIAGGSCVDCKACCEGLIATNSWLHKNFEALGCDAPVPPGSGGSCVKCGDGKCDKAHSENRCNCLKDCG